MTPHIPIMYGNRLQNPLTLMQWHANGTCEWGEQKEIHVVHNADYLYLAKNEQFIH